MADKRKGQLVNLSEILGVSSEQVVNEVKALKYENARIKSRLGELNKEFL